MKKNIWFLSLPVCALVFWTLLVSCNTSTGPEKGQWSDEWSDIISLDQLDGTWKGSYQQTIAIQEIVELLGQEDDDTMALFLEYIKALVSKINPPTIRTPADIQVTF